MRSRTPPLPSPGWITRPLGVALLLAALTLASLGTIVTNGFIALDDGDYITRNSMVRSGLTARGIWTAFTTTRHTSIWHPVTWVSHMIDVELFGLRPGAHHAVSLALHTANVLLLFLLLRSLTGALWRSAVVAALFAVHPLHVESVAWAAERKDVLSTFFLLLSLGAYLRAARHNAVARSAAIPLFFALALMSKAMVVTLPFVFLLLDWWPLARWAPSRRGGVRSLLPPARLWREKSLLFVLCAGSAVITYLAQSAGTSVSSVDTLPFSLRLSNAAVSYARYLGKTLWPSDLSPFYPYPEGGLPLAAVAASVVLLAALTVFVARTAATRPYLAVGWFWFLGTLVPVIGFVQTGGQAMADRYTYFTLTGVLIALTWGVGDVVARVRGLSGPAAALSLALIIALATVSRNQAVLWRGDVPLFSHALRVDPDNWAALNVLGNTLLAEGRADEAAAHYRRAMALHAGHFDATHNLGLALAALGRREEALQYLQEGVKIRPGFFVAHRTLGRTLLELGRFGEALEPLQTAVKLDPYDADSRALLGMALHASGQPAAALENMETALRLDPDNSTAHLNFGLLRLSEGRTPEATSHFRRLLELNPGNPEFSLKIGAAYQEVGRYEEALAHLAKSLELAPGLFDAHLRIGEILFEQGKVGEAIDHLRKAVELLPANVAALNNLGAALAQAGKLDEAIPVLRRALALNAAAVDPHVNLGLALMDNGELEEAAAEFLEAYALDPADARLAPALERLISQRGGEEYYARAVNRKPRPKGLPALPRR